MKRVILYRCQHCGGREKFIPFPWVRERVLSCAGQLEPIHILRAFEDGEYGVCVAYCPADRCHSLEGSLAARRRINRTRTLLAEIPFDERRLKGVCCDSETDLRSELVDFLETLENED